MAKFRVKEKSFINNAIREAGEDIDLDITHDPKLHSNLEPLEAPKAKAKGKGVKADASADAPADDQDETAGGDLA